MTSRRKVVSALLDLLDAGKKSPQIAEILAAYLLENGALRSADLYLKDLRAEIARRYDLMSAEVTSAHQLEADFEAQIVQFVKKQTGARQVEIISKIDRSLISGVVISTTDSEYDGSLKQRIKKLRAA